MTSELIFSVNVVFGVSTFWLLLFERITSVQTRCSLVSSQRFPSAVFQKASLMSGVLGSLFSSIAANVKWGWVQVHVDTKSVWWSAPLVFFGLQVVKQSNFWCLCSLSCCSVSPSPQRWSTTWASPSPAWKWFGSAKHPQILTTEFYCSSVLYPQRHDWIHKGFIYFCFGHLLWNAGTSKLSSSWPYFPKWFKAAAHPVIHFY